MERKQILESLKEQYDDELTLKVFTNYIEEFQQCFGKYISTEEIINRLKLRVKHNIQIIDEYIHGKLDGQYDINSSTIRLYKDVLIDTDNCAYLAFHELTHALTVRDLPDGRKIMGFSYIKNELGMGFNEAMTEWLTKIRNEKFGKEGISGYETIVEQIIHLAQIIGEDNLINCFLFEPEKLEKILKNNNMDYNQLEESFYRFIGKDEEVYFLGNHKKINNIMNYNLYRKAEIIFNNYSKGIGNIETIEAFKRKFQILNSYKNNDYNLNKIMELQYYTNMLNDVKNLTKKGVTTQEICNALSELKVPAINYNLYNAIKNILSGNKKQTAILLNDFFKKYPNDYYYFAYQNYCFLYDQFAETPLYPQGKNLYDVTKYAMIGKFISEHPNYEYEEISTEKIIIENKCEIYCFKTQDNNCYMYTLPNGIVEKLENNEFKIIIDDIEVLLTLGDTIRYKLSSQTEITKIFIEYFEYSQLDDIEFYINMDTTTEAEKEQYRKKIRDIKEKINGKVKI